MKRIFLVLCTFMLNFIGFAQDDQPSQVRFKINGPDQQQVTEDLNEAEVINLPEFGSVMDPDRDDVVPMGHFPVYVYYIYPNGRIEYAGSFEYEFDENDTWDEIVDDIIARVNRDY